jgi:DNA-binding response OmpR family regulator
MCRVWFPQRFRLPLHPRTIMNDLSNKRIKILVVDDERSTVDALKISLESDNYIVVEAYTGDGAVRKARSEIPDLILLDVMLPDRTGYEICNGLRKDPLTRTIPIIMVTGMGETDRILGLELGAIDYITKPFDLNILRKKIRSVLGG